MPTFGYASRVRPRVARPRASDLLAVFLASLAVRLFALGFALLAFHIPFAEYADKGDGESYQRYAAAICGDPSALTEYDTRVFPGYPALIALVHEATRLPFAAAGLAVTLVSAALAASLSAALFADIRIGWAMVALIPHWPVNSSLIMGEAPLLALIVGGLLLGLVGPVDKLRTWRTLAAGVLLGIAGLVRPVACFAVLGLMLADLRQRRFARAASTGALAAAVVGIGLFLLHRAFGDALHGVRVYASSTHAYGGQIFRWPFESLVTVPLRSQVDPGRVMYIYLHVVLTLVACARLARRALASRAEAAPGETVERVPSPRTGLLDTVAAVWLIGNTLFIVCIGSGVAGWGFHHFPRFMLPALPALFWAFRDLLPRRPIFWALIAAALLIPTAMSVSAP
jgi:hypothetical protein